MLFQEYIIFTRTNLLALKVGDMSKQKGCRDRFIRCPAPFFLNELIERRWCP